MTLKSKVIGLGFVLALTFGAVPSSPAAPVMDGAALTHVLPAAATDVRWGWRRHHGWRRHWGWRHRHWGWRHRHWGWRHRHWGWRHRHWRRRWW